ncbi:Fc.00g024970.m01.CDS01 [Cosmosporella sp. VM-42]
MSLRESIAFWLALLSAASATALPKFPCSPETLIDQASAALGGEDVISNINGVTYHAPNIYRSRSLMQSYELTRADVAVAITGSQNISFSYSSPEVVQRIDRHFVPSDYWVWGSPRLDPFDFSLVVRGGKDGFGCYIRGNNQIWLPPDLASGYTDDLYLGNYTLVDGIRFPHSVQTVYNSTLQSLNAPLEDYMIESITLNPDFPADFFEGLPEEESFFPKAAPKKVQGISHARITEFSSNMLWSGITNATVEGLKDEQPVPGLPHVHCLILDDDQLGVKQVIIEFETAVIVCDAPPQWTSKVIEWIAQNIKKPVTHLFPTHHHRDHSGGAAEYVAAGAKLIVPEMAVKYWSSIPDATFVTFNNTHPYSYTFITSKCPSDDSPVAVFKADAWQAGMPQGQSDQALMRQWLDQVLQDGLPKRAHVLPTHGQVSPLLDLIDITGYPYPAKTVHDWRNGAAFCY